MIIIKLGLRCVNLIKINNMGWLYYYCMYQENEGKKARLLSSGKNKAHGLSLYIYISSLRLISMAFVPWSGRVASWPKETQS